MPRHKDPITLGLEHILNDPRTSFLTNPTTFNELHKASGMSVTAMLSHIGKRSVESKKSAGPSDSDQSKQRLAQLSSN